MLNYISNMTNKKNLLAFSAGEDSSVLFFLLLIQNIEFDLIMVNYNLREQSQKEVEYAKELANKYNKQLFLLETTMDKFNENEARKIRYKFFDENMTKYDNLIFAHHLNDKLEWFLMQMTKGAGVKELNSFKGISERKDYLILRPLIDTSKEEIISYGKENNIKSFYDESNSDTSIKRNYFRHNFSNELINNYKEGIKKTFQYIQTDEEELPVCELEKHNFKADKYFTLRKTKSEVANFRAIDKILKLHFESVLTTSQKKEMKKFEKYNLILRNVAIQEEDGLIHIAPYIKKVIPKKDRELLRVKRVPPKIRGYIHSFLD